MKNIITLFLVISISNLTLLSCGGGVQTIRTVESSDSTTFSSDYSDTITNVTANSTNGTTTTTTTTTTSNSSSNKATLAALALSALPGALSAIMSGLSKSSLSSTAQDCSSCGTGQCTNCVTPATPAKTQNVSQQVMNKYLDDSENILSPKATSTDLLPSVNNENPLSTIIPSASTPRADPVYVNTNPVGTSSSQNQNSSFQSMLKDSGHVK